jgi:GT2 family glycosyltransferase
MIRKKVIGEVGYFDKDYHAYVEEVDYCYRIKKHGWKIHYNPTWSITHYGGASSDSEFPILYEFKGMKIFYRKNMPAWQYPILRLFLKGGALLRIFVLGLIKGRGVAKTYVKAFQIA